MKFRVTYGSESDIVEFVEVATESEVCEHCGEEVTTYFVTAEDETWRMVECVPDLLRHADKLEKIEEEAA